MKTSAETAKCLEQWIEREETDRLEELLIFQQAEWLERERREWDNRLKEARLEAQRDVEELLEEDRVAVQYVLDTEDQSIITTSQWLDREKHQEELDRLKNVMIGYDPDNEIENGIVRHGMEEGGNSTMDDGDTDMQGHGTEDGGNGTMDDGNTDMHGHGTEDGRNGTTDKGDTHMQGHGTDRGNGMMDKGDTHMDVGSVSGGGDNLHDENLSENIDEIIAAGLEDMEHMLEGEDNEKDLVPVLDDQDFEERKLID